VRDAGPLLDELNELTRCDCTTRNMRKAAVLAERMDELEATDRGTSRTRDLSRLRPALDGDAVMEILVSRRGVQSDERSISSWRYVSTRVR